MPKNSERLLTRLAGILRGAEEAGQRSGPATLDEAARSVGVVLATEHPAQVWDWERGLINEVLLMSGAEYPEQVPFLDAHNRSSVESQLGSLRGLRVEGAEMPATAFFSKVPKADDAFTKVREGHVRDLSVGYRVFESVWIPEGTTATVEGRTFTGPLKVSTRWQVKEGSLTPIGADEYAKVRHAANENILTTEAATMAEIKEQQQNKGRAAPDAAPNDAAHRADNQRAAPTSAEAGAAGGETTRADCADMVTLALRHGCPEFAEQAIREGMTIDRFRAVLLDRLGQDAERHAPAHRVAVGESDGEKFNRAAADAILLRTNFGHSLEKPAPGASELRGYTLKELARECLRRAGKATHGDAMDMVGRALTTSSDFPAILADAAHKSVLAGAEEAGETFGLWTGTSTAVDFREHTGVSLDSFSSLDLIPEGAEYKYGQISDRGVTYSVATYGKLFVISRKAIVNDDLNALTMIPYGMGRAAMRTVGDIAYYPLLQNPQQADGKALFSPEHKNLAATGKALDVPSFGAGVTAMGTHKNGEGQALNIRPSYLITPIALQAPAFQLLHGQVVGTQAEPNKPNPWAGFVVPVPEGRLDGTGPLPWFLAGAKGFAVNVAWLSGNETPRVEQRQGWTVDGTEYKVSIDAGAYVADWRALYKNPGVVPA